MLFKTKKNLFVLLDVAFTVSRSIFSLLSFLTSLDGPANRIQSQARWHPAAVLWCSGSEMDVRRHELLLTEISLSLTHHQNVSLPSLRALIYLTCLVMRNTFIRTGFQSSWWHGTTCSRDQRDFLEIVRDFQTGIALVKGYKSKVSSSGWFVEHFRVIHLYRLCN